MSPFNDSPAAYAQNRGVAEDQEHSGQSANHVPKLGKALASHELSRLIAGPMGKEIVIRRCRLYGVHALQTVHADAIQFALLALQPSISPTRDRVMSRISSALKAPKAATTVASRGS